MLVCPVSARAKITSGFSESFRRGIVTLPKIRNPKLEIRNKPEGPKSESQSRAASRGFEPWSFRILNLLRISDFGLRICRASNGGWAGVRILPESRILFLHRPLAIISSAFHGRGVQPGGCGTRSAPGGEGRGEGEHFLKSYFRSRRFCSIGFLPRKKPERESRW